MRRIRNITGAVVAVALLVAWGGCGDRETPPVPASTDPQVPVLTRSPEGYGPVTLGTLPSDPDVAAWATLMLTKGLQVIRVNPGNAQVSAMLGATGSSAGANLIVFTTPALVARTRRLWSRQPRATVLTRGNAVTAVAPTSSVGGEAVVAVLLEALRADGWR